MLGQEADCADCLAALVADMLLRRFGPPKKVAAVGILPDSDKAATLIGAGPRSTAARSSITSG